MPEAAPGALRLHGATPSEEGGRRSDEVKKFQAARELQR
jgi:hypothetical protein